jgi:hypothetical protein
MFSIINIIILAFQHAEREREVQASQFRELLREKELELQQLAEGAHAASFVNGNNDNNDIDRVGDGGHADVGGTEERRLRDELRDKEVSVVCLFVCLF